MHLILEIADDPPPDSACTRGTRLEVVKNVTTWTGNNISEADEPHILWMHGYVGCGKSAISQEVCRKSQTQGRPVASFFFFRNAGDRSKIWRLAPTLANQMAAVVPETAPFVRAEVTADPGLKNFPVAITSVAMQMQCLLYGPLKSAAERSPMAALGGRPFLIVIDGLDECEDKEEIQELVEGMLAFFDDNPFIPLRIFITSRVEQHIQFCLNVPGVRLDNLVDHCSDDDIVTFLEVLFENERRRNPVIRAYISEHGEWPIPGEKRKLVRHIGGSFIFASSVFKFIMGSTVQGTSPITPMDRLPLALKMNPGLDGLYAQTLARSENLPHFLDIISTIALLGAPLSTSGIAELLGISVYEVVNVLVDLQAVIQVPGTDEIPVTLFHTSLRDFLVTQTRSGRFFAHPRHHIRLFLCCLQSELVHRQHEAALRINLSERKPAAAYALQHSVTHLVGGEGLFKLAELNSALDLCRETLGCSPGAPELIQLLGDVAYGRARHTKSLADLEEAIAVYRNLLHPSHSLSFNNLGRTILDRYRLTGATADLEEAISLCRESLKRLPYSHPDRSQPLHNLGTAILDRYRQTKTMAYLEEAIFLYRGALEFCPSPHQGRPESLNSLGNALLDRWHNTRTMADLEEAIALYHEALELRPSPHQHRSWALCALSVSLYAMYKETHALPYIQEAILHCEELLAAHFLIGHQFRPEIVSHLAFLLRERFDATGQEDDLGRIASLEAEASQLPTSASTT
ncbi:hypothetical protein H1R20_g6043, partial [Candolleomyces eurysporus]